jgi:hypothetical protein
MGQEEDIDRQVNNYFERSELDKQAVVQRIRTKLNDHYSLTSSICGLRYFSKGGVPSSGAFNQKTVGTSFAQDDTDMNIMRIAWICYHSPNQTYERALDQNFAAWSETKIMTDMNVTYITDTMLDGKKAGCVLQLVSNEMNHSRTRIFERGKNLTKTRISLSLPVHLRKEGKNRSRKSKSIYYVKRNDDLEYTEVSTFAIGVTGKAWN